MDKPLNPSSPPLPPPARPSKRRLLLLLAACALYLAGLGWIDRATGYELGLFAFYTAPVAVVAWNCGQVPGVFAAFIASVIWCLADRFGGNRYSSPFYAYWNTGMHFTTFIINAVTFAKIKAGLLRRQELERALHETRQQMERPVGATALCPHCHNAYLPEFRVARTEAPRAHATSFQEDFRCCWVAIGLAVSAFASPSALAEGNQPAFEPRAVKVLKKMNLKPRLADDLFAFQPPARAIRAELALPQIAVLSFKNVTIK
jgi:hypothetical protein